MNNDNTQYITITMINTTQNNNEQWLQWTMTIHQKKRLTMNIEQCTTIAMSNTLCTMKNALQ